MAPTSCPCSFWSALILALSILTGLGFADSTWILPLSPPGNEVSSAWGANIISKSNSSPHPVPLVISNGTQAGASNTSSAASSALLSSASELPASNNGSKWLQVNLANTNNPQLLLGQNAVLGFSDTSQTLPTVPFGLNLGLAGRWNGSVIFGGDYDANRIYDELRWKSVPESNNTQSTFLATGILSVDSVTVRSYHYPGDPGLLRTPGYYDYPFPYSIADTIQYTVPAILNFSSNSVVLPDNGLCGKNLTLTFNPKSRGIDYPPFDIPLFADLTASSNRCSEDQNIGKTNASAMILGIPFFQAAYIYVDSDTTLWFSSVNEWSMPVNPMPFNSSIWLGNPPIPASVTQTAAIPTSTKGNGGKIKPVSAFAGIVSVGLALFLLL